MKRLRWLVLAGAVALAIGATGIFCGCEDTPEMADLDSFFAENPTFPDPRTPGSQTLDVVTDPDPATVTFVGDTVSLRVRGGPSEYEWWIVDNDVGEFIQPDEHTDTVVYQAKVLANNTVYVMDSRGRAAIVRIAASEGGLALNPTAATVSTNAGATVAFQVVGGVPPYDWSVTDAAMGEINAPDPDIPAATYVSKAASGVNIVTVVDSRDARGTATVTHSGN